jgi:tRNA pseudouridine38-40 synthase
MKLKGIVEYEGTDYYGWQVQPDKITIQGTIEAALEKITGKATRITGAGRTDAGVHALGQVISFDYSGSLDLYRLIFALNSVLPRSICLHSLDMVHPSFDARRDALSKLYRYALISGRSPLRRLHAWEYHYELDLKKMKEAVNFLAGEHDYSALCEVDDPRQTIAVDSIDLRGRGDEITIEVCAPGFLYKMVRRIVGILTDCGRGRIEKNIIPLLFSRVKPLQVITAPANGLVLVKVNYEKE